MYQRLKSLLKSPLDETLLKTASQEISALLPLGHNLPFLGLALGIVARLEYIRTGRGIPPVSVTIDDEEDMGELVADPCELNRTS